MLIGDATSNIAFTEKLDDQKKVSIEDVDSSVLNKNSSSIENQDTAFDVSFNTKVGDDQMSKEAKDNDEEIAKEIITK